MIYRVTNVVLSQKFLRFATQYVLSVLIFLSDPDIFSAFGFADERFGSNSDLFSVFLFNYQKNGILLAKPCLSVVGIGSGFCLHFYVQYFSLPVTVNDEKVNLGKICGNPK